jgi:hypothetical protein
MSEYYLDHRDEILARVKDYDAKNHATRHGHHDCPCGGRFTLINRAKHYKSQIHKVYLDSGINTSFQPANILDEGRSMNMNECGSV